MCESFMKVHATTLASRWDTCKCRNLSGKMMVWKFACIGNSVSNATFQLPRFSPVTLQKSAEKFKSLPADLRSEDAAAKEWPVEKLWLRLLSRGNGAQATRDWPRQALMVSQGAHSQVLYVASEHSLYSLPVASSPHRAHWMPISARFARIA